MAIRSREVFTGAPKQEKIEPKEGETWRNFFIREIEEHLASRFSSLERVDVDKKTDRRKEALEDSLRYLNRLLVTVEDPDVRKNFSEIAGQAELISDAIAGYVRKKEEETQRTKEEKARKARKGFYGGR
jgi:hypothetical protein